MDRKIKICALLLIVLLIIVLAFFGVHKKISNIWNNLIPEFNYGMELKGARELKYTVDTSEEEKNVYIDSDGNFLGVVKEKEDESTEMDVPPEIDENLPEGEELGEDVYPTTPSYATEMRIIKANEDEALTIENFEICKKIIQKRLEARSTYEYNIRLDAVTGEIIVEVPEDGNAELIAEIVSSAGKLEIVDYQTGIILMDNSYVKKASMLFSSESYQPYLQLEFNEDGAKILDRISHDYKSVINVDTGEEEITYVSLTLDDTTLLTTYFGDSISNGILQIPIGNNIEDFETYQKTSSSLENIVNIINFGKMPVKYTLSSDLFIQPAITDTHMNIAKIIFAVTIALVTAYMVLIYKAKGVLAGLLSIGYIALLTLVIRYTNVNITINALIAFNIIIIINYVFMINMLNKMKNDKISNVSFVESMKELYIAIIPVCVIALVCTFMPSIIISSIGMVLFWGIIVQALYSIIFVRTIYNAWRV